MHLKPRSLDVVALLPDGRALGGVGLGSTASLFLLRTSCTYSWVRSSIKTGQANKGQNIFFT